MSASTHHLPDLCAPAINALHPYVPGKPVSELEREFGIVNAVKLASNENPFGPSPRALAAAAEALPDIARYPDGSGFTLSAHLAELHTVSPGCITLGNGSNDVLDIIARVFLMPGREAIYSEYAFAVYPIVVQAAGARASVAPAHDGSRGPAFGHDLSAMQALVRPDTRLVFIANPNNPTGTWLAADELMAFLDALPDHVMTVVDEAYFEYVKQENYPDTIAWLDRFPRLIVTRTFSKAYGLAGLRVGYSVSQPSVADLLNRVRHPFNVNSVAQAAAVAALGDSAHIEQCVRLNTAGMQQLVSGLDVLGLSWIESVGNFITFDAGREAAEVYEQLLSRGVIVRPVANYGMPCHLRVTVGLADENGRFLAALKEVLA